MAKQTSIKAKVERIISGKQTKRDQLLNAIMVAAYHTGTGVGAWFNGNRRLVSYEAMREASAKGIRAKERGVKCNCFECRGA